MSARIPPVGIELKVTDLLECTTDFVFRRGPFKNATGQKKVRDAT
jgi:hypothetical protein